MFVPGFRLDASFDRVVALSSDFRVRLRWIRPTDGPLLRAGYARLSAESRYMRFFAAMRELPDYMVRHLTDVDGKNHAALIALSVPEPGEEERALGVARFVRSPDEPDAAEIAITVADDVQRRGLGSLLLVTLAAAARERAVDRFTAQVLSSNTKARRLLERAEVEWQAFEGDVSSCTMKTTRLARRAFERWRPAA